MRQEAFRNPHTCPRCHVPPAAECVSKTGNAVKAHQIRVDLYLSDVTGWIEEHRRLPDEFTWQGIDVSRSNDPALYADLEGRLRTAWATQAANSRQPDRGGPTAHPYT